MMIDKKTAIFGGTFDPPHIAHRQIAEAVIEQNFADSVLFVPAAIPPHKQNADVTPFHHRLAMVGIMAKTNPRFAVSDIEAQRAPLPSFTLATLRELNEKYSSLSLLIGGDSLEHLHTWHRASEIIEEFDLIVYPRTESQIDIENLSRHWPYETAKRLVAKVLNIPRIDVSSTEIRKRVEKSLNVSKLLDQEIEQYIKEHQLYKKKND